LERVLRKTLAANPAERPADGAVMARELMLCLNPRAWDLVNDLGTGWRDFARRHPLLALFPVNLPIFLLAGGFNLWYNAVYFLGHIQSLESAEHFEQIKQAFWFSAQPINPILYSLGTFLVLASAMPVARALARLNRGEAVEQDVLVAARRRAIVLGHFVAAIGLSLWVVAGIAFPISIYLLAGPFPGCLRFVLSMLACGVISCCFPFLATTWLSIRVYFPALLVNSAPDAAEQQRLVDLGRQAGFYLFTSPVAPLVAILLVSLSEQDARFATVILVVVAIAGFGAAYATWQRIRMDLEALSVVVRPADAIGTTTDTVETF
jgi:hypothetical protein